MFQDFSAPSDPITGDARLKLLRTQMGALGVDALVVPHGDEQRNEYLPSCNERLAWLTGFTGSAGAAIITQDRAILFVDGRYTLQAAEQVDENHIAVDSLIDNPPAKWLQSNLGQNTTIGIDPWLHSENEVKSFERAAKKLHGQIQFLDENLIDQVWDDRPSTPLGTVNIHPIERAGRTTRDKLEELNATLIENDADFCVLTDASSVSWLFNIRGEDVVHTPLVLAHAILRRDELPLLFIDKRKADMEVEAFLNQVADLHPPSKLDEEIAALSPNAKALLDPALTPYAIAQIVRNSGGTIVSASDPASLPRACKNTTEIEGSRAAHLRDGAAVSKFLCWLDQQPSNSVDEISAAQKLEQIRAEMAGNLPLKDISFDTISGSGPNGAIVHYRVNETTNRTLKEGELYLVDSGAQHEDGTTDITRTVPIGEVGDEEKRTFTLVLKGHIALALARFPTGTRGVDLDVLARNALWQNGMDYAHGTGHGVGSYLAVHEGPQNISKRGMQELLPGMIVSNEPGYYKPGAFGIRIENLVLVTEEKQIQGGDRPMLGFENLTLAPIDIRLIKSDLLSASEREWLNQYHTRVRDALTPLVDSEVARWLDNATQPL